MPDSLAALHALACDSLARGHCRVACRRYLMLCATGAEPSADLRAACELHLSRLPPRELSQMRVDAWRWARFSQVAR